MERYLVRFSREEIAEKHSEEFQCLRESQARRERERVVFLEQQQQELREQNRQRKQRQQERQRKEQIALGLRKIDGTLVVKKKRRLNDDQIEASIIDESSKVTTRLRARCQNWFLPHIWKQIDAAVRKCHFRTGEMVKELRKQLAGDKIFKTLAAATIHHWIDFSGSKRCWSKETLQRVEKEGKRAVKVGCLGRPRALHSYVDMVNKIKNDLNINRNTGIPISVPLAQTIVLGHVQTMAPELLAVKQFKCSETFLRMFLSVEMRWSWRTGMRAAQKTPTNWEKLCEDMVLRIVYHSMVRNILPEAMINGDQMGIRLIPLGNKTWAPEGSKQVDTFGKEEKRQFTVMVATTCSGMVLPFQCIWKGSTKQSLPAARVRTEAEKEGFIFSCGGNTHWSNLPCMKEWIMKIIVPYLESIRRQKGLTKLEGLLIIDVWSVHRGAPFRVWMKTEYSWIKIVFVPGGCTGKMQPNDIGIQRVIKHIVQEQSSLYFVKSVKTQLEKYPNQPVKLNVDLAPLRNASVDWVLKAYEFLKTHPTLVRKAWANCQAYDWNLSYECITSERAISTVQERLDEDPEFTLSLAEPGNVPENQLIPEDTCSADREFDDDLAIPATMLAASLGLEGHVDELGNGLEIIKNAEGTFIMKGGIDDEELTDNDAEGDTDPEYDDDPPSHDNTGPQVHAAAESGKSLEDRALYSFKNLNITTCSQMWKPKQEFTHHFNLQDSSDRSLYVCFAIYLFLKKPVNDWLGHKISAEDLLEFINLDMNTAPSFSYTEQELSTLVEKLEGDGLLYRSWGVRVR